MELLAQVHRWIERSWNEVGSQFDQGDIGVAQFPLFRADDLAYPFKNKPLATWRLHQGKLIDDPTIALARVPYVAFCVNEGTAGEVRAHVQWAPRCGYGYVLNFAGAGQQPSEHVAWIS